MTHVYVGKVRCGSRPHRRPLDLEEVSSLKVKLFIFSTFSKIIVKVLADGFSCPAFVYIRINIRGVYLVILDFLGKGEGALIRDGRLFEGGLERLLHFHCFSRKDNRILSKFLPLHNKVQHDDTVQ